jgi:glutathione synthase/RimK-type ligase-like ATP-grasp enzyme
VILRGYYLLRRVVASARRNPLVGAMDRNRDKFYAQAWNEAAEAMRWTIVPVEDNFFRIVNGHGTRAVCVNRNLNPLDSQAAVSLADDKPATSQLLSVANIPVPEHLVVRANEHRVALEFLKSSRGPVVVKPAVGTGGGNGVSTNVTTASQLRHTMAWAAAFCRQVLIERQVEGETFRLLYLDGELLDCVIRRSPSLVGDGVATVRVLVASENRKRLAAGYERSQSLLGIDNDMKTTLAAQRLRLSSVPEKGRKFMIKRVVNENIGVENETATGRLCDAVIDVGRTVANMLGLRLVGIDIITTDPGLPLHATGGAVIDVNGAPGFYYHYHKNNGRVPLARHILRGVFDYVS